MTLAEALARHPGAEAFTFGDGPELCARLLALVRSGVKTATCGALRDFEAGGEAMPVTGGRAVALDWNGAPALVIETTEVALRAFRDVPEDFALAEGGTFEEWREGHEAFFARNGGFHPGMMLVCERFRLVEDLAAKAGARRA